MAFSHPPLKKKHLLLEGGLPDQKPDIYGLDVNEREQSQIVHGPDLAAQKFREYHKWKNKGKQQLGMNDSEGIIQPVPVPLH